MIGNPITRNAGELARATAGLTTALMLLAISGGCTLPPPAEERSLTVELDAEFRADPTEQPVAVEPTSDGPSPSPPGPGAVAAGSIGDVTVGEARSGDLPPPIGPGVPVPASTGALDEAAAAGAAADPGDRPIAGPPLPVAADAHLQSQEVADRTSVVQVQESTAAPIARVDDVESTVDLTALDRDPDGEGPAASVPELVPVDVAASVSDVEINPASAAIETAAGPAAVETPPTSPFEARTVDTPDGAVMSYRIGGKGARTLVFIHGWCGDADQWTPLMETLAARFRVVAVDLVGHGSSRAEERDPWTISSFGADIARLLEREDLRDVVLIGHAMGGPVALEAALRATNRVTAIVGVDSLHRLAGAPDPERSEQAAAEFERDYRASMKKLIDQVAHETTSKAVRDAILADAMQCSTVTAVSLMRHFGTYSPVDAAQLVECRVVCINSNSVATDIEGNRKILSGFRAVILPDVGHWPHLADSQRFATKLIGELEQLPPVTVSDPDVRLTALSPVLYCDSPANVAEFYESELRFKPWRRLPKDETLAATLITMKRDDVTITIQSIESRARDLGGTSVPTASVLFLVVSNYESELAKLSESLREAKLAERELDTGSKQITFQDPAGNVIIIQEASRSPTAGTGKATEAGGAKD